MSLTFDLLKRVIECGLMTKGIKTASPYLINFNITNKCNSHCMTCGVWRYYVDSPNKESEELTLSEIKAILNDLPEPIWLTLGGGEVFLRNDLYDICKLVKETYPDVGLGISTNGLESEKIIDEVIKITKLNFSSLRVSVSLDGIETINDKIRGRGSYNSALTTYWVIKNLFRSVNSSSTGLNYTISKFNAGLFESFFAKFPNEDIGISLFHIGKPAFENDKLNLNLPEELVLKDLDFMLKNYKFVGEHGFIKKIFVSLARQYVKNPKKMVLPCSSCISSVFIDPYGMVYPCTIWGNSIGCLREKTFKTVWTSDKAKQVRNDIKQERCPICWSGCESSHTILQSLISLKTLKILNEVI